ncbi:MAG: AmmeMemoRadiSam system protein A [Candidatus Hydrogenedentes bacterium]|nr:AmmeMemoRadiSam system protein A [Candidatus Hydrogenedentota bacterium]
MTTDPAPFLNDSEQSLLLKIARDTLTTFVGSQRRLPLDTYPLTDELQACHGAFVTLRASGTLRGCIGHTRNIESLAEAVRDNTINAAARDPRFTPVTADELSAIRIEISALCPGTQPGLPFIPIHDISEISLGRDGLYLDHAGSKGGGLLLPQVPGEQGWDLPQFLEGICRKAGAAPDAWKHDDCQLYRFSAQVFRET